MKQYWTGDIWYKDNKARDVVLNIHLNHGFKFVNTISLGVDEKGNITEKCTFYGKVKRL